MDHTEDTAPAPAESTPAEAPAPAEPEKKPEEEITQPADKPSVEEKKAPRPPTFEDHAKAKGTPEWLAAAMKAYRKLPVGKELPEGDFDDLAKEVAGLPCGYDIAKRKPPEKAKPKEPAK